MVLVSDKDPGKVINLRIWSFLFLLACGVKVKFKHFTEGNDIGRRRKRGEETVSRSRVWACQSLARNSKKSVNLIQLVKEILNPDFILPIPVPIEIGVGGKIIIPTFSFHLLSFSFWLLATTLQAITNHKDPENKNNHPVS